MVRAAIGPRPEITRLVYKEMEGAGLSAFAWFVGRGTSGRKKIGNLTTKVVCSVPGSK
jgi:hypothetical protein